MVDGRLHSRVDDIAYTRIKFVDYFVRINGSKTHSGGPDVIMTSPAACPDELYLNMLELTAVWLMHFNRNRLAALPFQWDATVTGDSSFIAGANTSGEYSTTYPGNIG